MTQILYRVNAVLVVFACLTCHASVFGSQPETIEYKMTAGASNEWMFVDDGWREANTNERAVLSLYKKESNYSPPFRSPRHIALLKQHSVSDFSLELEAKSTHKDYNHRDVCVFLGYQNPSQYYYIHLGKKADPHSNQIFIVNKSDRAKISLKSNEGTPWDDQWHHVRVTRNVQSGLINVYFDDMESPAMTAKDKTFTWGQVGVGSFDDIADFANVKLTGKKSNQDETVQEKVEPPVAEKKPFEMRKHGDVRIDNYYWMNDREDPKVIDFLNAENKYMEAQLAPTKTLQEKLAKETKARIKQTDQSVPYKLRGFVYYSRTEDGKQYPIYCRKLDEADAKEEVVLDVNKVADGHKFCSVGGLEVSPGNDLLAYAVDTVGRRKYKIVVRNLETGQDLNTQIADVTGNMKWAADNETIFYTRQDPETLRWHQVFRTKVGKNDDERKLVYEEKDEEFSCYVMRSRSDKYIFIENEQTLSSDYYYIDSAKPESEPVLFHKREADHEYSVDHFGDKFYIRTNWNASNFRLMEAPEGSTGKDSWKEVVPHDKDVFFENFELFNEHLVLEQKFNGLARLRIRSLVGNDEHDLDFGEPVFDAGIGFVPEANTKELRFYFSSFKTPSSTFAYDMDSKKKTLLKQDEVLGGFDSKNYKTERVWAEARDGTKVPVSVIYHVNTKMDGSAPCLLYAYGSYGSSMEAAFRSSRFNLIDRGFVYAIAHIRGGQEMGRHWYEDGKLLKKINTFTDFIDAGRHLVKNNYANKDKLYARGGSAGGLLMGAVANMAPELFDGIIADVPFVDVVTTMLDDTIPLTTSEYDEWGNPNDSEFYKYMLSYSPYDQVEKKAYPNMLVTTGLHDSQVQYWEPAKWVAKLREMKTDDNMLIMKTNMSAGHGGSTGRYDRYKEIALRHAFLLHLAGIKE